MESALRVVDNLALRIAYEDGDGGYKGECGNDGGGPMVYLKEETLRD
jgi:hypothetical protein